MRTRRSASIDIAAAKAMPGVVGVLTGAELAADGIGNLICGWMIKSKDGSPMKMGAFPALAKETVRYVGQACRGGRRRDARPGARCRRRGRRRLGGASRGHRSERRRSRRAPAQLHPEAQATSIYDWELGDGAAADAAFAKATHVTKLDIVNNRLVPNAMEPRAALGVYDPAEEHYTLWTTSQNPHVARLVISAFYNVAPEHKLRVIAPDVGGGFGSKIFIYPEEIVCLWASKKTGVPVKWAADRTEAFLTDAHGRDHVTHAEMAFDADNKMIGLKVDTIANFGAYMSLFSSSVPTYLYATLLSGQYVIPAIHVQRPRRLHQHDAGRRLSRRRPAGGDLRAGAPGRDRGARARRLAGRAPAEELHPQLPLPDAGHHDLRRRRLRSLARRRDEGGRLCRLRQAQGRGGEARQAARHRHELLHRGLRHRAVRRRSARSAPASACGNRPRCASTRSARSRC